MTRTGTPSFIRFAEQLKRVRSKQAEIAQEAVVRREEIRASQIDQKDAEQTNLSSIFAASRGRPPSGSTSN
jgi:hypothetical protein